MSLSMVFHNILVKISSSAASSLYCLPVAVVGALIVESMSSSGTQHTSSLIGQKYDLAGHFGCINFTLMSF